MALTSGMRLGPYEIVATLGAGGMGEVYRARDTRLNRDVALKVLPDLFKTDPDRLARFTREAHVLASLNHPNIAAIHGVEDADGVQALVLELVEGPTLADRIALDPIPLDEALPIARQIADALEAAHDQGVVHRDLKPANIKLRPDATVKVLDFGLAKALDPVGVAGLNRPDTMSPTITTPAATGIGVILGTAAYMAPEQARGRAVDKRADIWAFGCVVFEMLTGARAFEGEDVAETLGAIIHKEPDWSRLPVDTPSYLRTLLRRCLQKDPKKRLPHIGIARLEIDEGPTGESAVATVPSTIRKARLSNARLAWAVAAIAIAATLALVAMMLTRRPVPDPQVVRASILPPANVAFFGGGAPGLQFVLSPDGRTLAFQGREANGRTSLWVRPMEASTAQRLAGTEDVTIATWSPNSRFLAFVAGGRLRKIDVSGGPALTLAEKATNSGLAWSAEDVILYAPDRGALFSVPAGGGTPSQVTTLETAAGETGHWHPFFLPDSRHFLYAAAGSTTDFGTVRALYVGSLDPVEKPRLLLPGGGSNPRYASGHLLFLRETTLMAQPFDADRLELTGEAVPLAEQIQVGGLTGSNGAFSVSQGGVLAYRTGSGEDRTQLTWYERSGRQIGTLGEPANQMSVELSPDGTRALVSVLDLARRAGDLWIYDVRRNLRTRFTFDAGDERTGAWSPDGSQVVFNARRKDRFDLYRKASNGTGAEQLLASDDQDKFPYSWSADGRVVYGTLAGGQTGANLWTVPTAGDRKPAIFLQTEFTERWPRLSFDGRWLAYASNESGRFEVYVTSFPDRSGKWQVSGAGGDWPRWRRDGRELFYLGPDSTLMAAAVSTDGAAFQAGAVEPLFQVQPRVVTFQNVITYSYDVTADGQRFLVNAVVDEESANPITLLVNWPALLRR